MASESTGTKGQPYFSSSGAPAIDVDPGLVADYAAAVGNRKIGTTAERLGLGGKLLWVGLRFGDLTDLTEYQYTVSGWVVAGGLESTANVTTFSTGWTATSGAGHVPRLHRSGRLVTLVGSVTVAAGGNPAAMLTIPTAFRPPNASTRFIGGHTASSGVSYELSLANGVVGIPAGYITGGSPAGTAFPLFSSWILD